MCSITIFVHLNELQYLISYCVLMKRHSYTRNTLAASTQTRTNIYIFIYCYYFYIDYGTYIKSHNFR